MSAPKKTPWKLHPHKVRSQKYYLRLMRRQLGSR